MKRGAGASVFGYFWGNAKSDWPRAAMEREGSKDQRLFHQTLRRAQGERWGGAQSSSFDEPPSP